jgi:hypothetical protein
MMTKPRRTLQAGAFMAANKVCGSCAYAGARLGDPDFTRLNQTHV